MRNIFVSILLFLFSFSFFSSADNINTSGWKTYLSYYNTNLVEESADEVFVIATGSLYVYGKEDNSIRPYHKGNGLNDNNITHIRYNNNTKSLLIVYANSNMDVLEGNSIRNIPHILNNTSITDKTINSVMIFNEYAYLSTAFGIVVFNMEKKEIKETYNLGRNITSCAIQDGMIYATATSSNGTPGNVLYASLESNLLDKANWKPYVLPGYSTKNQISGIVSFQKRLVFMVDNEGVYCEDNGSLKLIVNNSTIRDLKIIGNKLACLSNLQLVLFSDINTFDTLNNLNIRDISTYQTDKFWIAEGAVGLRSIRKKAADSFEAVNESIVLDGPYQNSPYKIIARNNKIYMIPGGKAVASDSRLGNPGTIMIYENDKWSYLTAAEVEKKFGTAPRDYTSMVITSGPSGEETIYASSYGDGIVQLVNREPVQLYDDRNSPIENAGGMAKNFCFVDGLAFDKDGNLWMTNSQVQNSLKILDKDGKWHSIYSSSLNSSIYTINSILITSKNDKWVNVPRPAGQARLVVFGNSNSPDKATSYMFESFTDTDNKDFSPNNYLCMAEDKNGYIWIGTNKGAVYFTKPDLASSENHASMRCTRVKLVKDDGTPYYFLDNIMVSAIRIDAGNQKWIGTQGNGVYVLDADNEQVVHQFNTSNSPLLSNNIYSIDINDQTGEVFIGTDQGLVSYKGEATEGKESYSDVYAYPNPVRPEDADHVTITGLMNNSNIKITDLNGNIIYQTKSLGGQATWNCRNKKGIRVASGIYLVLAATEDSSESVVTKIAVVK